MNLTFCDCHVGKAIFDMIPPTPFFVGEEVVRLRRGIFENHFEIVG